MQQYGKSRRVVTVSFSGVDGAGKSTQIEALRTTVEQMGVQVQVIRFWDDIACLKQLRESSGHKIFKGDKGVGSPDRPIIRRDKNVRSWPMSIVRLYLYTLDAFSTRRVAQRALRTGAGLVIFDRYMYDELANLSLGNPFMRLFIRLVMKLVPSPDVSYVLDADPVEARARKPEYPVDFIQLNRRSYHELSRLLGGMTVIPPMPIERVRQEVLRHASTALARVEGSASAPSAAALSGSAVDEPAV